MNNKKIAILLPFKDHFTNSKGGSASIWIKDFNKESSYKKNISVFGNTNDLNDLVDKKNYININFNKYALISKNISYVNEFIKLYKKFSFKLIEIHNRPSYVHHLIKVDVNAKLVLIFHNQIHNELAHLHLL